MLGLWRPLQQLIHHTLRSATAYRLLPLRVTMSSPPAKRLKPDPAVAGPLPTLPPASDAPVQDMFVTPSESSTSSPAPLKHEKGHKGGPGNAPAQQRKKDERKRKFKRPPPEPFSPADVLWRDIRDFLGPEYVDSVLASGSGQEWEPLPAFLSEVELRVGVMTVSGESLSLYEQDGRKSAVIVPFAHPGDLIRAKIFKHDRLCAYGDLLEVLEYNEDMRGGEGDRRVNPSGGCKYFGECGGCQLQPMPYEQQLAHKHRTLRLAYTRFSDLPAAQVPDVLPTIGSPKQWAYRTKVTPHFDAPPKHLQGGTNGSTKGKKMAAVAPASAEAGEEEMGNEAAVWEPRIGFERKGKPGVMDIEECPIATPVLNAKLVGERQRIRDTILSFKKGSTLLLRDSLPAPDPVPSASAPFDPSTPVVPDDAHVAITDHKAAVYERVGDLLFTFEAGHFFQNNNSILVPLVDYVREAIFPAGENAAASSVAPTHLVDAYCGSGLFGLSLSPYFERVAGVEISPQSVEAAGRNADMNGLSHKTTWLCGKAEDIFGGLPAAGFEGSKSCVVIDFDVQPPRKGCDTPFLEQLLAFRPTTIVYVSCNVHTQARDVGWFLRASEKAGSTATAEGSGPGAQAGRWKYVLESLRGFDLFPQTAHVEGVAVLRLVRG